MLDPTRGGLLAVIVLFDMPAVPNCCCSKGSVPYWSNAPFLISDIRALWRSGLNPYVPVLDTYLALAFNKLSTSQVKLLLL